MSTDPGKELTHMNSDNNPLEKPAKNGFGKVCDKMSLQNWRTYEMLK